MRTLDVLALCAASITSGCGILEEWRGDPTPAAYTRPAPEAWMLVTPPERTTALELREILDRLPATDDSLPKASGEVEVDRLAVRALFEKLKAEPSAGAKARLLVEDSVDRSVPVAAWNQVREFKTEARCQQIRSELQAVTRDASQAITVYDAMPLYELEWLFLEWSNRWAECVPIELVRAERKPGAPATG